MKTSKTCLPSRSSITATDNNFKKVKEIMFENRPVGIGQIAEDLNISYGSTRHILVYVLVPEFLQKRL